MEILMSTKQFVLHYHSTHADISQFDIMYGVGDGEPNQPSHLLTYIHIYNFI